VAGVGSFCSFCKTTPCKVKSAVDDRTVMPSDTASGISAGGTSQDPGCDVEHPKAKLLERMVDLVESEIPRDSGAAEYALAQRLCSVHARRAREEAGAPLSPPYLPPSHIR
jgi:hypothetical protein